MVIFNNIRATLYKTRHDINENIVLKNHANNTNHIKT